jgi:hypothetical protein
LSKVIGILFCFFAALSVRGEVKVTFEHNREATAAFAFKTIPAPLRNDLAANGKFTIVSGESDPNGSNLRALNDGRLPEEDDRPTRNFFFKAGDDGGRLQLDLGTVVAIKEINSYSWHTADRAPQVYKVYGADGAVPGFNPTPKRDAPPDRCGWSLIATVDTRPQNGEPGGQYGVSIFDTTGALGNYRYLLFDVSRTESRDPFGNTFYSEIDVRAMQPTEPEVAAGATARSQAFAPPFRIRSVDGYCEMAIDSSEAPDLKEWAEQQLAPVLAEWYPKIVAMLPSEGYAAPKNFSVTIRPGRGVAATGGNRITANSEWLKRELDREAIGALLHEEVHVIQQYRGGRRNDPDYTRPPGWLVEGIPDYIRWFLYEPQSHGADAAYFKTRKKLALKYDGMYRISANFLNYVIENYGKDQKLLTRVNAACRQGTYQDDLWKEGTGRSLEELNEEWRFAVLKQLVE